MSSSSMFPINTYSSNSVSSVGMTFDHSQRASYLKEWCKKSRTENLISSQELDSTDNSVSKTSIPGKVTNRNVMHQTMIRMRQQCLQRKEKRLNLERHHRRMDQLFQQHQQVERHPKSQERQTTVFDELRMSGVTADEALYRQRMYSKLCTAMGCYDE